MKRITFLTIVLYFAINGTGAQPGVPDAAFGENGVVKTYITSKTTSYSAIAVQNDGKIVTAGYVFDNGTAFAVARYTTDGKPDSSFNGSGAQITPVSGNDYATAVIIQPDGKIVVGGNSNVDFAILRYNSNGSLDKSFDGDGIKIIDFAERDFAHSLAIQIDGKILIGGIADYGNSITKFALARTNANGSLDETFGNGGRQTTDFGNQFNQGYSLLIDAEGKILMAGTTHNGRIGLVRYNEDGTPDSSFSGDGILQIISGNIAGRVAAAFQSDGKILIAASSYYSGSGYDFVTARYNKNGTADNSFASGGIAITNPGVNAVLSSIAVQPDGKIIIAGNALTRFNSDGSLDQAFTPQKEQIADVFGPQGIQGVYIGKNKLYATGFNQAAANGVVARYLLDVPPSGPTVSLATPADGAIYLSGGNVYLNSIASTANGTINKVAFYNGSALLFTATDRPYIFKWEHVAGGNYALLAKATDNNGLATVSDTVHISVVANKYPVVNIISPADGQVFLKGATLHLKANAQDADGRIIRVAFYNGETLLTTEYRDPYTFDWKVGRLGNYTITARATDNWGAVTTSAAISVEVVLNQPPAVALVLPFNGQTFTAPATINFEASAQDTDGRIARVSFCNGKTVLAYEHKPPYTYQWKNVPAGIYTITAIAKDNWSAETASSPVNVKIIAADSPPVNSRLSSKDIKTKEQAVSIQLLPNPVNNILNIYTTGLRNYKQLTISVISSSGVVLQTKLLNNTVAIGFNGYQPDRSYRITPAIHLNVSSLASGVYTIKIKSRDKVVYSRFVKL